MSVEKTRNAGTWSEARYWGAVRSALRRGFRFWKPITDVKNAAKRAKKNGGRQKWEYKCADCKKWYKGSEVQVDHIIPVGTLRCAEDIVGFLERLTAEAQDCDGNPQYQVLCKSCHQIKTNKERSK